MDAAGLDALNNLTDLKCLEAEVAVKTEFVKIRGIFVFIFSRVHVKMWKNQLINIYHRA